MMKIWLRRLAALTLCVTMLFAVPGTALAAGDRFPSGMENAMTARRDLPRLTGEWAKEGGHWVFYLNGEKTRGFQDIDGKRYYFDSQGYMRTGWIFAAADTGTGYTYYYWFYAGSDGALVSGWRKIDGFWFYFSPATVDEHFNWLPNQCYHMIARHMHADGDLQMIDGKYYIFNDDGIMQTGWYYSRYTSSIDFEGHWETYTQWFYIDPSGVVVQNGWRQIDGSWYYFRNFDYQTKWQQIDNAWYFFGEDGKMRTGWQTIGGSQYFFKSNGVMAANEYCQGYWLNPSGTWTYPYKASWHQDAKGWWYGDPSGWYARNQTLKIDGKMYTFDANGYMK